MTELQKENTKQPESKDVAEERVQKGPGEAAERQEIEPGQAPGEAPLQEEGEGTWQELKAEYDAICDKHLRLMAEYDNFRKRSQKERDEIYPNATAKAVEKFLPVLDNLERAAAFPHGDDDFGKGFDMIYQSFQEVLTSLGVEEMGKVGEPFDADLHHAVMHIEDEALGENVVAQVLQKGYRMGEKVIRYAMVQTAN